MKFALIALALTTAALANEKAALDMAKSQTVQHLDARITHLQAAKNCVSSATTRDAMKACQQKLKSEMMALREATKAKRKEMKETMIRERAAAKDAAMKKRSGN